MQTKRAEKATAEVASVQGETQRHEAPSWASMVQKYMGDAVAYASDAAPPVTAAMIAKPTAAAAAARPVRTLDARTYHFSGIPSKQTSPPVLQSDVGVLQERLDSCVEPLRHGLFQLVRLTESAHRIKLVAAHAAEQLARQDVLDALRCKPAGSGPACGCVVLC